MVGGRGGTRQFRNTAVLACAHDTLPPTQKLALKHLGLFARPPSSPAMEEDKYKTINPGSGTESTINTAWRNSTRLPGWGRASVRELHAGLCKQRRGLTSEKSQRGAAAAKPCVRSSRRTRLTRCRQATQTSIKLAQAPGPDLSDVSVFYNILKLLCHYVDILGEGRNSAEVCFTLRRAESGVVIRESAS